MNYRASITSASSQYYLLLHKTINFIFIYQPTRTDNPLTLNMAPKTTSSTLVVGDYKYIFLNRPDTQHIDYIRFKSPDRDVQTGKIGTSDGQITASEGPIDTLVYGQSIRVYYIANTSNGNNVVREIKLDKADSDDTDPTKAWTSSGGDLKFEAGVLANWRLVDASSFLAVTSRNAQPALIFKPHGEDKIQYIYYDTDNNKNKFIVTLLSLPE
jgi:hypothetical protein